MSQLLNALKRLDKKVAVEPVATEPQQSVTSEVIPTPDPASSVEQAVEQIAEQIDDAISDHPSATITEEPDIVWPPEEPPSGPQAVQEGAVLQAEATVGTVIDDVQGESAEGADLVVSPESPPDLQEDNAQEEVDVEAAQEVDVEAAQEVDDQPTTQDADVAAPHDEPPTIDSPEPTPSSPGVQFSPEPSPRLESTPTRIVAPRVPPAITVDAETLQLSDRVLSQMPLDRSATVGLFRASPTQTDRQVALQLATGIAMRTGERVLVIDADWQRAARSLRAAGDLPAGLGEVLMEQVKWSEAIVEMDGPQAQVSLIGPGQQAGSRVAGHRFLRLIDEIGAHFRYILVDAGLAVSGSPAAASGCYDLAYLVSGLNQTDRVEAIEAAAVLRGAGIGLQGCIVTYAA